MQQFIIIAYNARFCTTPTLCAFKDPFIRCINAPSMNAGEIVSDAAYMTINFFPFHFLPSIAIHWIMPSKAGIMRVPYFVGARLLGI